MNNPLNAYPPVISVDPDRCVNCHACIAVCPVKFCNDGSDDHVEINPDSCLGCGRCLTACTHDARRAVDDLDGFLEAVDQQVPTIAFVAPSIVSSFPGGWRRLNTWLRSVGVSAVFDVSFGAELTVQNYVNHIESHDVECMIASPCPAVVSYISIYKPDLIPFLAPYDSPMLHTLKMVQSFYPQYRQHRSVILSPCLAKKHEFVEAGLGDYNVTMKGLKAYLNDQGVDLSSFAESDYDQPPVQEGSLFPAPGGLLQNVKKYVPGIEQKSRQIEGSDLYPYLDHLSESIKHGMAPLFVDCLSCSAGCNGGPGSAAESLSFDELDFAVKQRYTKTAAEDDGESPGDRYRPFLENVNYDRRVPDFSDRGEIVDPSDEEVDRMYREMLKEGPDDILDCTACGYNSCRDMAKAIYNGLNRTENCHKYLQKNMQLEHEHAQDAMRLFQDVFELSHEAIILVDQREVIRCNEAACELFGMARAELLGISLDQLLCGPSGSDSCYLLANNLYYNSLNEGAPVECERSLRRADGTPFVAELWMSTLQVDERQALQIHIRDITADKNANENLKRARDEAEQASRAKSEFLANMSHEIRTPMNGVLGMADLLAEESLSNPQKMLVRDIIYSANSLLDVINDILDISRIEAHQLRLETEPFSVTQTIDETLRMLAPLAEKQNNRLSVSYRSMLPDCLIGDPVRFRQILMNLLGNAIKFTKNGRVDLIVDGERLAGSDDYQVEIVVRDEGIGIAPEKLPLIFDKFSQADTSTTRKFGGTGLGLAITRELVNLMDGVISVSSQLGMGTEFTIQLHFKGAGNGAVPVEQVLEPVVATRDFCSTSVLLVEDNRVNQLVIRKMLESFGCTVSLAENGEEALSILSKAPYDIVFMDCAMPVMDGFEAARQIREQAKLDGLPVIAITAHAMQGDDQRCYDAGMDGYVVKPVKRNELLKVLTHYC